MEFCSTCGSRMMPKKIDGSNLLQLVCPKCNETAKKISSLPSELVGIIKHNPRQLIAVIDKKENLTILP
jgi:DNA-directed RNA polymerase subunit M/transcription elongation factor TFIIS